MAYCLEQRKETLIIAYFQTHVITYYLQDKNDAHSPLSPSLPNKKHNRQAQNRQGEARNSGRNGEAKELICTTHGHELRGALLEGMGAPGGGGHRGKNGTTVIA